MPNPSWADKIVSAKNASSPNSYILFTRRNWMAKINGVRHEDLNWYGIQKLATCELDSSVRVYYRPASTEPYSEVAVLQGGSNCRCGRPFKDPKTGVLFAHRIGLFERDYSLVGLIEWLKTPPSCKTCFYLNEWNNKRWIPKSVKNELGIDY